MDTEENNLKKPSKKTHAQFMDWFDEAKTAVEDERKLANFDVRFIHQRGAQWDDWATKARGDRPRPEINLLVKKVEVIKGDQKQSRINSKIRASGGGAKEKIAQTLEGLVRTVSTNNKTKAARDNAFDEAADCGIGAYSMVTQYEGDNSFNVEPCVRPIRNARNTVFWMPDGIDSQHRDSSGCFVIENMSRAKFKRKWPKAKANDTQLIGKNGPHKGWSSKTHLQVGDFYHREPVEKTYGLFTNGEVYEINAKTLQVVDELLKENVELARDGNENPKVKKVTGFDVKHYKLSGSEILEGPNDFPSSYIPVMMVYGFTFWDDEGRHSYGLARHSIDAQRDFNYAAAVIQETSALSAKDPLFVTKTMIEGYEKQYQTMGAINHPVYYYNPDQEAKSKAPHREGAPQTQAALINQLHQAEANIMSTTGIHNPSIGDNPANQSGRALLAQQAKGDAATFTIKDNLANAVNYETECLIDIIQRTYDTERQARIVREDGETEDITFVNKEVQDEQSGETVLLKDMRVGKYDIVTDIGPSYSTKRVENLNALTQLAGQIPALGQLGADVIAGELDITKSGDIVERFRKQYIQQGIIDPNDEEIKEMLEAMQRQQQIQQLMAQGSAPNPQQAQQEQAVFAMQQKKFENEILAEAAEIDKTISQRVKDLTDSLEKLKAFEQTAANIAAQESIFMEIQQALTSNDAPQEVPVA